MAKRKNGEGSFNHLPNGKVRMRLQYGRNSNGGPRILTVTGSSETDALRKMRAKVEAESKKASYIDDVKVKKMTLAELCEAHLEAHIKQKDRLKDGSVDRRAGTIKNQIRGKNGEYALARLQVLTVTPQDISRHIEMLITESGLAVSSIEKVFYVINAAYSWAVDNGYIDKSPCNPVKDAIKSRFKALKKKENAEKEVIVLSEHQIDLIRRHVNWLKDNAKIDQYLFGLSVLLLLYTGMRAGELCALRWSDWDSETKTLSITKTRYVSNHGTEVESEISYSAKEGTVKNEKSLPIVLRTEAQETLQEMKRITPCTKMNDYIYLNSKNRPSNSKQYSAKVKKFYKKAGIMDYVGAAHTLRRTFATLRYQEGSRIEDIAAYIRDEPDTVRRHYINLAKKIVVDGKAINAIKL